MVAWATPPMALATILTVLATTLNGLGTFNSI